MTHRGKHYSPYRATRSGSSPRGSRDLHYSEVSSSDPEGGLFVPVEGVTYVPRRASDTLIAPRTYRPSLEDYHPLRRKSDQMDVALAEPEEMSPVKRQESTESHGSQRSSGQDSQDTLVLPAVTVPTTTQETLAKPPTRCPSDTLMLPAVTVTADPSDMTYRPYDGGTGPGQDARGPPCSLQVPATRVRNVLMVRGRRSSSVCVAGAVFGHALVGLIFLMLPSE